MPVSCLDSLWKIRNSHNMVPNLHSQLYFTSYIFIKKAVHTLFVAWVCLQIFQFGVLVDLVSFGCQSPNSRSLLPWGNENCSTICEFFAGHYKEESLIDLCTIIMWNYSSICNSKETSQKKESRVLGMFSSFSQFEVNIWLNHLKTVLKK